MLRPPTNLRDIFFDQSMQNEIIPSPKYTEVHIEHSQMLPCHTVYMLSWPNRLYISTNCELAVGIYTQSVPQA